MNPAAKRPHQLARYILGTLTTFRLVTTAWLAKDDCVKNVRGTFGRRRQWMHPPNRRTGLRSGT